MKVNSNFTATEFYTEQNGQWYKVVTANIAISVVEEFKSKEELWDALESVGFQREAGRMTAFQNNFTRDFMCYQDIPVPRCEVDERCIVKHVVRNGSFKTVEGARRWIKNGCPM